MENKPLVKEKSFADLYIDRRTIIRLCPTLRIDETINVEFPASIETLTRWEGTSIAIRKSDIGFQFSNQKTQSKPGRGSFASSSNESNMQVEAGVPGPSLCTIDTEDNGTSQRNDQSNK